MQGNAEDGGGEMKQGDTTETTDMVTGSNVFSIVSMREVSVALCSGVKSASIARLFGKGEGPPSMLGVSEVSKMVGDIL
jgi:hypothetical protein